MSNRNWFVSTVVLSLLLSYRNFFINAQSQNAIGAHRTFAKTSFSCSGRPAGYYADIETGCQVYHMCDGLGRQFSYSCPNTTLFQQRMLICDHWYMVNCSKAESDYTANLLIGQRDKPFVNEEENNLRTPRPDLLDRPYAPDYSGESFRNQYQKSLSSILNQIYDNDAQKKEKSLQSTANQPNQPAGQQRWKIPPPSRLILPPAYEPQIPETFVTSTARPPTSRNSYYSASSTTTVRPLTQRTVTANSRSQGLKFNGVAALHNRNDEHLQYEHDDLGTSHSTRYNTSADFNSNEDRNIKNRQKNTQRKTTTTTTTTTRAPTTTTTTTARTTTTTTTTRTTLSPNIKVPSKIYEPPLLYPIYNFEETSATKAATTTVRPLFKASTASPFMTRQTTTTPAPFTTRASSRATTMVGKPFTRAPTSSSTTATTRGSNRYDADKLSKEIRTPAPAQGFKAPTPRPTSRTNYNTTKTSIDNVPSKHLLPPLTDFIQHDVATTQGPPIYYEWKVPSDGLEPPKKEAPIGVDGREYPETVIDYNSISASGNFIPINNFGIDQTKTNNNRDISRTPASRSIKETGQPTNNIATTRQKVATASTTARPPTPSTSGPVMPEDIFQIRKELSVPEYAFPLENIGRTGYLATDVYNSFQLKIPERRSDTDEHLHWFGENPKCPECHPSYVIPGTCEPCLRR
uniref:Uncharacterized protein n=1 Tax=Musca domestica TaxID=7370 RepID=A0A1I8M2M2_MUSDO